MWDSNKGKKKKNLEGNQNETCGEIESQISQIGRLSITVLSLGDSVEWQVIGRVVFWSSVQTEEWKMERWPAFNSGVLIALIYLLWCKKKISATRFGVVFSYGRALSVDPWIWSTTICCRVGFIQNLSNMRYLLIYFCFSLPCFPWISSLIFHEKQIPFQNSFFFMNWYYCSAAYFL